MGRKGRRRLLAVSVVVLLVASCGVEEPSASVGPSAAGVDEVAGADETLVRGDLDCDEESLGDDASVQFVSAHYVVDGALGAVCLGEEDPTLVLAWEQLVTITPPGQLTDLGLFAAFDSTEDPEEEETSGTTLAFVNVADDEGASFQMSVNVQAFEDDPDEALLTLAHEFSHVFTTTAGQIDRSEEAIEWCGTYFNGEGCYRPDSLMAEWIELFWTEDDLASVDPTAWVGVDTGAERCSVDPSFLGPYAASTPEEDFAETFSAFVLQVDAPTPEVQEKIDWLGDQPGLVEFRDRAVAAGQGPLEGSFEGCG